MTALRAILWLATSMAAFAASVGVARRWLPGRPSERVVWGFAGVMTLSVVEVLALGGVWKLYTLPALLLFELPLVAAALWWTRQELRAEWRAWRRWLIRPGGEGLRLSSLVPLGVAGVVWSACLLFTFQAPFPGVDAVAYHLPIAVKIAHHQGLDAYDTRSGHVNEFPKNGQINFARAIVMTRDERPLRTIQWVAGPAAVVALFAWMRHWGASRGLAVALAPMFLLVPAVISQSMVLWGTIDLVFHAMLILVFTMLSWIPEDQADAYRRALWTVLAAGLAIGTKGQGLAIGGAALAALSVVLLARGYRPEWYLRLAAWSAVILLVFGSTQYVQNYFRFGNPFSPIELSVGGQVVFPGAQHSVHDLIATEASTGTRSPHHALFRSWGLERADQVEDLRGAPRRVVWTKDWVYDELRLGGWGLAWLLALLPGMILGIATLLVTRRWYRASIAVLLLLLMYGVPGSWWARFSLFQFGTALVLLSVLVAHVPSGAVRRAIVAWTLAVSTISAAEAYYSIRDKNTPIEFKAAPGKYLQSLDTYYPHSAWESREDIAVHRWVRDEMAPDAAFVYFHPAFWGLYHYYFYNHTFANRVDGLGRSEDPSDMEEKLRARRADFFMVEKDTPEYDWARRLGTPVLEAGKYTIYRARLGERPRSHLVPSRRLPPAAALPVSTY